jgi:2-C-methyl-D-erythritol 4-phosphate cytidylyltransferase
VDADNGRTTTVAREGLWHAYTPQMFRIGKLRSALQQALYKQLLVTDEASAMELAGYHPRMVSGQRDNIKITGPSDLELAAFYLQTRTLT